MCIVLTHDFEKSWVRQLSWQSSALIRHVSGVRVPLGPLYFFGQISYVISYVTLDWEQSRVRQFNGRTAVFQTVSYGFKSHPDLKNGVVFCLKDNSDSEVVKRARLKPWSLGFGGSNPPRSLCESSFVLNEDSGSEVVKRVRLKT